MQFNKDYEDFMEIKQNYPPTYELTSLQHQNIHANTAKVIYLGILFLILFTIFNGLQNVIFIIYTEMGYANLATFLMLTLFISRAFSNLIGPAFADKYAYNLTFLVASSSILIFLLAGKLTALCATTENQNNAKCSQNLLYFIHLVAGVIFGFFGSILWAAQSAYVNQCASHHDKGKFFGLFWSFMAGSQIFGSILTASILDNKGISGLFNFYILVSIIGVGLFAFVRKPDATDNDLNVPNEFLSTDIDGIGALNNENMAYSQNLRDRDRVRESNKSDVKKILKFFFNEKIGACIPLFILQGYAFTIFIKTIPILTYYSFNNATTTEMNDKLGLIFFIFGFSEVMAGEIIGYIFDKFTNYSITIYCWITLICIISIFTAYMTDFYWVYIITAIAFAFADVGGETIIGGLLSLRFEEKIEPFVVFRFMSTCSAAFIMVIYLIFPQINQIIMIVGVFGLILMITCLCRNQLQNEINA